MKNFIKIDGPQTLEKCKEQTGFNVTATFANGVFIFKNSIGQFQIGINLKDGLFLEKGSWKDEEATRNYAFGFATAISLMNL